MVQHLVDRAIKTKLRERKDAEHDKADVAHGGISDQTFDIGLDDRDQRAINNADDGEDDNDGGTASRG